MRRALVLLSVLLLVVSLTACKTAAPEKEVTDIAPPAGSTGDPPLIPHEVAEADGGAECLACHLEGDEGATKTPHPHLVDCRQCHIPSDAEVQPFQPSY